MKSKHWKLIGIMVLIGVMVCVVTYAGKHKEISLPDVVKGAVNALYPEAKIEEVKVEEEGLKVFEVELEQDEQKAELTISPDGTILEVVTQVAIQDLPAAVAEAIPQAAEGTETKEVKQEATYWVVTLKKLETPQIAYEVELIKDGREIKLELDKDGTILEQEANDNNNDDNDDEEKVTIDEVPAAVKATILAEAQGGAIEQIKCETEDGQTIYEAEVIINGQEVKIKVAADGKLTSKGLDDEDDEEKENEKD